MSMLHWRLEGASNGRYFVPIKIKHRKKEISLEVFAHRYYPEKRLKSVPCSAFARMLCFLSNFRTNTRLRVGPWILHLWEMHWETQGQCSAM